jgi:hypothetical protein
MGSVVAQTATSSYAAASSPGAISCDTDKGESYCGYMCCASNQVCASSGQCAAATTSAPVATNTGVSTSTSFSVPLRPTSGGTTVVTSTTTGSKTSTVPYEAPAGTANGIAYGSTKHSGLSGGAIAGIVIGVIVGIFLLLLICFCCCLKGAADTLLALIGLGPKKRRTEETYIEHDTHHSGGRPSGGMLGGMFGGGRPSGSAYNSRPPPKKSGIGLKGVLTGLAALAAILGIKRKLEHHDEKSSTATYTDSGYMYSDSSYFSESK